MALKKNTHFDMHSLASNVTWFGTPEDNLLYNKYKEAIDTRIPADYVGRLRVYIEKKFLRRTNVLVYLAE